jgi:hypothetical protein
MTECGKWGMLADHPRKINFPADRSFRLGNNTQDVIGGIFWIMSNSVSLDLVPRLPRPRNNKMRMREDVYLHRSAVRQALARTPKQNPSEADKKPIDVTDRLPVE